MPTWSFISFQDAMSPIMENLVFFHDHVMIMLIMIMILILYIIVSFMMLKKFNSLFYEGQQIETIWTLTPSLILIMIAFPSMKILYMMEEMKMKSFILKTIGHQWYWSYESNIMNTELDIFMEENNFLRILKTTENVKIPTNLIIQMIISSEDVIHSWTIPSMGIKVDAVPGRLNQTFFMTKQSGLFTGQCSEICGANHSFMPILLTSLTMK